MGLLSFLDKKLGSDPSLIGWIVGVLTGVGLMAAIWRVARIFSQ